MIVLACAIGCGGESDDGGSGSGGTTATGGGGGQSGAPPGSGASGGSGGGGTTGGSGGAIGGSGGALGGSAGTDTGGAAGSDTGGTSGAAGADTGGAAGAGGAGGTGHGEWGSTGRSEPGAATSGSCAVPCALEFEAHADYVGGTTGATLFYDPAQGGSATLRADPTSGAPGEEVLLIFTYEDNDYGNGVWVRASRWFIFVEPYEYEYGYSLQENVVMTAQLVDADTHQLMMIAFEFGDRTVGVHEVWEPGCAPGAAGACGNEADCPIVDSGVGRPAADACLESCSDDANCPSACISTETGLSSACADCYQQYSACVAAGCSDTCPGQGGNACMLCEVDTCREAFQACSGLDHVPPGLLTYPG